MTTATDFQNKLEALKSEQAALINSSDSKKKAVRARIQQINVEFFETKREWREKLGMTF
jgi:hypothetical protein